MKHAVEHILELIDKLPEEDLEFLEQRLVERGRAPWLGSAAQQNHRGPFERSNAPIPVESPRDPSTQAVPFPARSTTSRPLNHGKKVLIGLWGLFLVEVVMRSVYFAVYDDRIETGLSVVGLLFGITFSSFWFYYLLKGRSWARIGFTVYCFFSGSLMLLGYLIRASSERAQAAYRADVTGWNTAEVFLVGVTTVMLWMAPSVVSHFEESQIYDD
ncbi:MAG: hypothetical protein KDA37_15605 [Planctomycetales bacterium]|nr:hypothetical protein [Planctomycetales bacterium]